jgi:hypothetical protein
LRLVESVLFSIARSSSKCTMWLLRHLTYMRDSRKASLWSRVRSFVTAKEVLLGATVAYSQYQSSLAVQ